MLLAFLGIEERGYLDVDFGEEVEGKLIFHSAAYRAKLDGVGFEVNLLLLQILDLDNEENAVFALGPFDDRVTRA